MITSPSTVLAGATAFDTVYQVPHEMQYRFFINDVLYTTKDLKRMPKIERLLFNKPEIGIVATGTLDLTIYPKGIIPKAARIFCECQLTANDGRYTSWYPIGTYFISKRQATGEIMNLQCRDSMVKAGRQYAPLTRFTEWPASSTSVASEIAGLMGVSLDPRSSLNASLKVDYPNELLMSEVLAMIAAMHGGSWVVTAENKLRLIPYPNPSRLTPVQDIGKAYGRLNELSTGNSYISRVTLSDDAGNEFSYGDDNGLELGCKCFYSTAAITQAVYNSLRGAPYQPYEIQTAYLSPLVEVGDVLLITKRSGEQRKIVIGEMTLRLSVTARANLKFGVKPDDEEEIPYISPEELRASRTVSQLGTYFGNRINRSEGFVSEYVKNGVVVARMTANANLFTMQQKEGDTWRDRIYIDPVTGNYVIDGNVTIKTLEKINEEIASKGGEAKDLYDWIHSGEYKMTASEFNIFLTSDGNYKRFYNDVFGGEGSVSYKANYVFSDKGFNAKLTADESFTGVQSTASASATDISTIKKNASYVFDTNGFSAQLGKTADYTSFKETVLGDGTAGSDKTKNSVKYKADYVFSTEGFSAKLSGSQDFSSLKTTVLGDGKEGSDATKNSIKYKAEYVFGTDGFNTMLSSAQNFTSLKTTVLGDGNPQSESTKNSVKYKADYVFSTEGFSAKLSGSQDFSSLKTTVLGDGNPQSDSTKNSVKYKADYVFGTDGFNALLTADTSFKSVKSTAETSETNIKTIKTNASYVFDTNGFSAELKKTEDYTSFKKTVLGDGTPGSESTKNSVKYKADYVFGTDGFNAKLTADTSFKSLKSTAETSETNIKTIKTNALYVFNTDGFSAELKKTEDYKTFKETVLGDGTAGSESTKKSIKYKAEYVFGSEGFNALLQANTDYKDQKTTISATAEGLEAKVDTDGIIAAINLGKEGTAKIQAKYLDIEGADISLTGRVSANRNVVIDTNGLLTAKNMKAEGGTFTNISATGKLVGGNWTFDTNGGKYADTDGRKVVMEILSGGKQADGADLADDPHEYRAYYIGSNCDVVYGSEIEDDDSGEGGYSSNVFIRGKRIILMAGRSNYQKAIMGLFKDGEGSGTDFSFFPYEDSKGNIGSSNRKWDYVRGAHAYSTSSSRTRKENIQEIIDAGSIIDGLQPVTFDYKKDHRHSAGFILEDVYKINPLFCDVEGDDFEHGGLFYEQFIPFLVKEVQSLRKRVKDLEESA